MSALEITASKINSNSSSVIKMNNQTIRELRAIAKERGLRGYYKLRKAELVSSLKETLIRPSRRPGQRKSLGKVTLLPKPEEMDTFEQQEMTRTRSVLKSKLNEWYDWLVEYVPESIRKPVSSAFSKAKNHVMRLYGNVKKRLGLKEQVEEQAEKEHGEEHVEGVEPVEHVEAMNGACKSFRIDGQRKADVGGYIALVKPHVQKLVGEQLKALDAAKVQMHLWVVWKKKERLLIQLDDDDVKGWSEEEKQAWPESDGAYETKVEKVFNSRMTEIFQGSDVEDVLSVMFTHIETQVEHPALPKSGFTLDRIMHLDIDFHKLELTRGSSHVELPGWVAEKKAVINPKNEDEECFKWAMIAALYHEEIGKDPQRLSRLRPFAERCDWEGLEFPVAINKISKFEKRNPEIAVNVLFVSGRSIFVARRSEFNSKRDKQANLLMIVDGEKRHYTAVKSLSRLLSSENSKGRKGAYHFCVNCLNGFRTESARDKHYMYCSSHGEVNIKMPRENEKWLKFHDGQCQFKVPFMLYADFESILKPVKERYRDEMSRVKTERLGKASYTEKLNTHVPSGWCVYICLRRRT